MDYDLVIVTRQHSMPGVPDCTPSPIPYKSHGFELSFDLLPGGVLVDKNAVSCVDQRLIELLQNAEINELDLVGAEWHPGAFKQIAEDFQAKGIQVNPLTQFV
ncbi:MAG: hypothetical protein IBX50_12160 [Marinospirillum sp.]|uniref:hypothetical protein n=1 Tax=Marinospirillum sp. TaxID=2183934 RepID=UPI0019F21579|nr:hypothetical protein [Marinospirillum sp.]MBE0507450.1 hypothetical protein [Marinospirillum sp.]